MQEREERVQLLLNTSTHFPSPLFSLSSVTPPSMFVHTQIGRHKIRGSRHDLQQPKLVMVSNIIYPCIVFLLLAFACVSQIVTCFLRDKVCHSLHLHVTSHPLTSQPPPFHSPTLCLNRLQVFSAIYSARHVKNRQNKLIWSLR